MDHEAPARPPIRINIDTLHIALVWRDPESAYRLDLRTGEIFLHLPKNNPAEDEKIEADPERYLTIHPIDPRHSYQAVADFVEFLPGDALRDELRKIILGKGAFRRFKDFIAQHPAEKELWLVFKEQREMAHVEQWLAARTFPYESYDPYAERRKARMAALDQARDKRIRIRRVDHVHLEVPDLDAARRFYEEILQLAPLEPPPTREPGQAGLWFRCGNLELHLTSGAAARSAQGRPQLAFEVASLAQAREALQAAGFAPGPDLPLVGGICLLVEDPGGNRIELLEPCGPATGGKVEPR